MENKRPLQVDGEENECVSAPDSDNGGLTELEGLEKKCDEFKRIAQRAQADLVNYRRQSEQERRKERERERERFGLKCAGIVDQLETAIHATIERDGDTVSIAAWLEGLRAVYDNFTNLLKNEGFERFDAFEGKFNPAFHEALSSVNVDGALPGSIAKQLRAGYKYNGSVIRPALVQTVAAQNDNPSADNLKKTNSNRKEEE